MMLDNRSACFKTPASGGLLSMRNDFGAIHGVPHPEERVQATAWARVSKDARKGC